MRGDRRALLALAISLSFVAGPAMAQECADYGAQTRWLGTICFQNYQLGANSKGLAARNDTLVAVDGDGFLHVIDASTPGQMTAVGSVYVSHMRGACDVDLRGDFAFVTAEDSLWVFSLADPTRPRLASALLSPSCAGAVTVRGDMLLQSCDDGLWIVDVADPLAPTGKSFLPLQKSHDAARVGNVVWVTQDTSLVAVDVADPAHPSVIGRLDGVGWAACLAVRDGIAYVGGDRLTTVDVSNPVHPALLGQVDIWGGHDIALDGNLACLTSAMSYAVVDVSDLRQPQLLLQAQEGGDYHNGVVARSGRAFMAVGDWESTLFQVRAVQLLSEKAPAPLGVWRWTDPRDPEADAYAAVADGSYIYCLTCPINPDHDDCAGTLHVLDVADPAAPHEVGNLDLGHVLSAGIAKHGPYVLVAGGEFHVVDVSRPEAPTLVSSLAMSTDPCFRAAPGRLQVFGSRVLALAANPDSPGEAIRVTVDISDPAAPELIGPLPAALAHGGLRLDGDRAYSARNDSLLVYDVTDVVHPALIGGTTFETAIYGTWLLCERNGLAYVMSQTPEWTGRIQIYDLRAPEHPVLLGSAAVPDPWVSAELHGGRLYLGTSNWGESSVLDVSDPTSPRYLGALASGPQGSTLVAADNCLVMGPWQGLITMPLACGTAVPVFVSAFTATRVDGGVAIQWSYAGADPGEFRLTACSSGPQGVSGGGVFSWTVPFAASGGLFTARDSSPRLAAGGTVTYTLEHRGDDVAPWLAMGERSVALDPPLRPVALLAPHPNPFNPLVRIPFVLAQPQRARLTVFDVAGRRIATLADGPFAAGAQDVTWDGTDARGIPAASGNYFLRLDGDRGQDTRRVMLIR